MPIATGITLVLPTAVSEDVRVQFSVHVEQLDVMLGLVTTSKEALALCEFIQAHLAAQIALIKLSGEHGDGTAP